MRRRCFFVALSACTAAVCALAGARNGQAVFFDLRGLIPSESTLYRLSQGGINVEVGGSGQRMKSGMSTFGIDLRSSPNDDPALIDGGSGRVEEFSIYTTQQVILESILISQFDSVDSGSFNVKNDSTFELTNGLNVIERRLGATSAHYLRWTGDSAAGSGRGFSVDGFSVRLVGTSGQAGDYSNDGSVDTADYVLWRKNLTSGAPLANDDTLGADAADYGVWEANFGENKGGAAAAVPESGMSFLCIVSCMAWLIQRGRPAGK